MIKIILSGEIGWEIRPNDIREKLENANGEDLEVHIASPGGGVISGIEIFNLFRDYKREHPSAQILAVIKGMAASMASYLAMNPAFDLVTAEDNAVLMIHNAWGGTSGDYREMLLTAEILEGLTNIIGIAYAKKTGKPIKDIRDMMDKETWLFGNDIFKGGFVDEMVPSDSSNIKDKATAIASAKVKYTTLSNKLEKPENKMNINQIAAMIKPDNNHNEKEVYKVTQENIDNFNNHTNKAHTPAQSTRDNNKTEVTTMTLEQFMAENPAAKIEYDNKLKENYEAGEKSGKEKVETNMKYAAPFLSPKSEYPDKIKAVCVKFLEGQISKESLEVAITMHDADVESDKSAVAASESKELGDTKGEQIPKVTEDGEIKDENDFNAEVNRTKKVVGMEV